MKILFLTLLLPQLAFAFNFKTREERCEYFLGYLSGELEQYGVPLNDDPPPKVEMDLQRCQHLTIILALLEKEVLREYHAPFPCHKLDKEVFPKAQKWKMKGLKVTEMLCLPPKT